MERLLLKPNGDIQLPAGKVTARHMCSQGPADHRAFFFSVSKQPLSFKIAALSSLCLSTTSREGTQSQKTILLRPLVHFTNLVFHFIAIIAAAVIYIIIIIIVSITKCLNMIGS